MTLRIAFVPGATPDKWARNWREQFRETLELLPVEEAEARAVLEDGRADMVVARLPVAGAGEDLHCVPLYEEVPVVVVGKDHVAAAFDELVAADLADEQFPLGVPEGVPSAVAQLPFPAMSVKDAVEVAAAGSGVVVMPMSLARLHHRKDVVAVVVTDLPTTRMGLLWPKDADDGRTQSFVGIVRGRTARSSRS